jgi:hypothetical protein
VHLGGDRRVSPRPRGPDPVDAARSTLARAAEERHPGWAVSHSTAGWRGVREHDERTLEAASLSGLEAFIHVADRIGMATDPEDDERDTFEYLDRDPYADP